MREPPDDADFDKTPAAAPTLRDPDEGVLDGTVEVLAPGCYRKRALIVG